MSLGVAVLILIPLVYHQDLSMSVREILIAPPFPRTTSAPPQVVATADAIHNVALQLASDTLVEPPSVPSRVAIVSDPAPPSAFVGLSGVPDGVIHAVPLFDRQPDIAPPPHVEEQPAPPDAAETPEHRTRIWIGGNVQAARLIAQPRTPYPPLARQMRVQGTVRLEALISSDGVVEEVRVLSGPPLLVQAALDSVRRWRYQPTLLSGEPVEVMTIIELNFTLAQ
jgi:protein TonB